MPAEADAADHRADDLKPRAADARSDARTASFKNASAQGGGRLAQRTNTPFAQPVQAADASSANGVNYTRRADTDPVLQAGAGQTINGMA